jgi:hypothetical protein
MTDAKCPLGFEAARKDWNVALAGREMTEADWTSLTFGEQARYGAAECKTKGANYSTRISGRQVSVTVDLPDSLIGTGFSPAEAKWLESAIHKKIEDTLHWMLTARRNGWPT